ncbi:glycosyltransferase family 2 protein [Sphingobacterium kitahiroshimense]|uniref:Glycosyltransferase family 2 protein n=1 Tax=Sphingobacterium kitahiroshimense TaxID=470446 RepID=A0ABV0BWT4_9SPHI
MEYAVSIIVPIYKVENLVERCARFLFEQTLMAVEYIFIDDCGGDQSTQLIKKVLQSYPHREAHVRFLQNEQNSGSAKSRNIGLASARGRYIAFCDGDDWLEQHALEKMFVFASGEDHDVIWTDFYFDYVDSAVLRKQEVHPSPETCIRALLTENMHGALWNKLYKRSLFERYAIRFTDGADLWEDLCLNIQFFHHAASLAYLPTAFYHYEQSADQSISRTLNEKGLRDMTCNVAVITDFLQAQAGEQYAQELLILKLAAKQTLLFSHDMNSFKQWRNRYPESNSAIFRFRALPLHLRFLGWCSTRRLWVLIRIWLVLKQINRRRNKL